MIKDYKGEMPNNVTTPEKAKAQKPFYKNWKFWFLTGLMALFGACSIYGLVLGSQYVRAVNEAAHIIADANSVSEGTLPKNKHFNRALTGSVGDVACVDLGTLTWTKSNQNRFHTSYFFNNRALYPANDSSYPEIMCSMFTADTAAHVYWNETENTITLGGTGNCYVFVSVDYYANHTPEDFASYVSGTYVYYKLGVAGETAQETFYQEGYEDGYSQGHSDGYQEGYSDGSDAINVSQSVKVLLPAGAENSCSFVTYLDGVPDQQGILSSSSSFGAYGEFNRDRNQKLRIDLTLPSGSRAFFMYVPQWTSAYPSDENYSLRQSWAVSGVTYLPTWVAKPEIYVGITSALVDDLTYDTISVAFDVDHWGDVKVGAYQEGYQQGYVDGQENPTAYDSGYEAGYGDGHAQGETEGFNRGFAAGSSGSQSLAMMFKTAFQLPFDQLYRFLNFNLLGINFLSLFTALISVSIGIMVIKKVL